MLRMGIRDDQWDRIKDILPGRAGHVGVTARNNRLFIDAVLYRYRTGIPWRDLPEKYGDFRNVHRRFSRWAEKGIWAKLLSVLSQEADTEYVMIDSTVVRAHQHSAGPRSEPTGHRPVTGWIIDPCFDRRPGQSDPVFADPRPSARSGRIRCSVDRSERRRGDRRQDADDRVVQPLKQAGIEAVIPPRSKRRTARKYDRELYKARHLIENFFCTLKHFAALPCGSAPSRHATISWHGTSRRLFSSPPP